MVTPPIRNVNGVANSARGWAYPEYWQFFDVYLYCRNVSAETMLTKPKLEGGTTKAYFSYAHTYSNTSYSFSAGGDVSGLVTGGISITPYQDSWSDFAEITINK